MGVKAFGFDEALADQAKSSLIGVLSRMMLRGLLDSTCSWKNKNLAVGEDAVNVEEEEFDFFGSELGR